ncbi:MAG TPA: ATP-binding protein, partial [Puia sp.]|nr:ATP-binding protein [Puia sp.]
YRRFDDSYHNLMELVADQIAQAVNNAIAYEEERKRADALAEIDKAKTRFFANISHEFRTPLTLILGNIEEVLNDGQTVAANNKRLELAHRNSMRLLRLVNSLLDFSRIESGRQQSRFMLTDMAALTKNLASNFRSLIERAGLEFEVDAEAGIKPVYVDRSMWEKIVFNLLSNAYKYTLEGKITVNLCADHGGMRLTVTDSGTGIPENELPHMFDRFHRVANSGGRTFEGSGIGLSLTKELVALHGGTIEVESVEGGGSTFDVIIPYGKEHLPASQLVEDSQETAEFDPSEIYLEENGRTGEWEVDSANGMSGNTENPLVLIVDDNADMREYVRSVVAREFRTLTAANGSEALDKINDHSPAIILSDIMMPVMDGIQLLKELKRNPQTQGIPVILLTARAGEESRIEGYDIGADDYLVKPFSTKEILSRIRAQLKIKRTQEFALKNLFYVFNEVPFSIAVLKGEDLVVEYANKYTLDIWQKSKEEVFGKPMFEIRPETRDAVKPIHEEVYRTGKRFSNYEIPVPVLRDGTTKMCYFNSTLDPMFNEEGKIIGQLATSSEVTEQVYARKKIEENEKELRHLNQQLGKELHATQELQNLGSQLIYKETGEQDVYDLLLGTATYLMGSDFASLQCYDPETESLRLLAHKNFHAASVSAWQKIKADSESVCGLALRHNSRILVPDVENEGFPQEQFDLYRLSGIRAVQSTPLISRSGGLVGMINSHWKNPKTFAEDDFRLFDLLARQAADLIERNESERKLKEGEEQLRNSNEQLELLMQQLEKIVTERTAELLKANRELESFTYIASHDLQEPLRKIISFIQLIEAKEEDANSFDKYFEKISAAARRMKALIESVLAYSYISKSELSVEIVDLNKVLSNVISDFEILINEKKATITFSKLPVIKGSPPQMHQLFSNIIGNSLKFTKRQPEIKITSARVMGGKLPGKGAIHERQAYVQLVFADNGIGFEPQFAEKIFVPFQRLHNRNEYGGTGIGLSIVQRIVERHSGEISVESKAGEGTVFSIWLPVA